MYVRKSMAVKKWYVKRYPSDEAGPELSAHVTFEGAYDALDEGIDFYDLMGSACDSIVRERIFHELALLYDVDYQHIYDLWLKEF